MIGLREKLLARKQPVRVLLAGGGYVGRGLFNAIRHVPNMQVVAVYAPDEVLSADFGGPVLRSPDQIRGAEFDVLADAGWSPGQGAVCALAALETGRHVVSINIECDVAVGPALAAIAREHHCLYTITAGDEPGELMAMYDHYALLGYRVVALGKGKNNPLDVHATPDRVRPKLPGNGITAEQVCGFVDGSKTMFEMGCLGNAIGFAPDVPAMHGPEARIEDLARLFREERGGGLLEREGVVDYVTGPELSGGVFIVVYTEDRRIRSDFSYLKIGEGPYYAFYQRFHNWFLDMPLSIARAAVMNEPTVVPRPRASCVVVARAKRKLDAGERLDGIGGICCYGELRGAAEAEDLLPHGIAEQGWLRVPVSMDEPIRFADVELDEASPLVKLWRRQRAG